MLSCHFAVSLINVMQINKKVILQGVIYFETLIKNILPAIFYSKKVKCWVCYYACCVGFA